MDFFTQLGNAFSAMSPSKRVGMLLSLAITAGGFYILYQAAQRPNYALLYGGMSQDDAGAIVDALKADRVPYRLGNGGGSVEVPEERVYELRLALAAKGLPRGGGVGFEIFDKQSFGMTDFVQRLNYRRALQGELARTISGLAQVESARVHLSIPEKRLFADDHDKPRASIVLNLKAGKTLSRSEIDGIVHLAASSVDGLEAESVAVVDQRGKLLSASADGDSVAASVGSMLEYQRKVEGDLERRIESLLSAALGAGKVIASVTAEVDFTQSETTKEAFDPDGSVVRSEQRSDEKNVGRGESSAGGVPGAKSEGEAAGAAGSAASTTVTPSQGTKATETVNYEISKTVNRTVAPTGVVKKISAAVMVDGTYKAVGEGADARTEYQPRSQEEMDRLTALIRKAVGYDEKRGDQIEVTNVPFDKPAEVGDVEGLKEARMKALVFQGLRYGGLGLLIALFFFGVVRPTIRFLTSAETYSPPPQAQEALPAMAELKQLLERGAEGDARKGFNEEAVALAQANPEVALKIVRNWLEARE